MGAALRAPHAEPNARRVPSVRRGRRRARAGDASESRRAGCRRPRRLVSRIAEDLAPPVSSPAPVVDAEELEAALDRFDEAGAQQALDRLLATLTLDVVLRDVLMPYLHELGERWERGEASVAQEHFASNLVRGRLMALARSWDRGPGHGGLLACAEGELPRPPARRLRPRAPRARLADQLPRAPTRPSPRSSRRHAGSQPDAVVISGTTAGAFDTIATGSARSRSTPRSTSPEQRPTRRSRAERTRRYLSGDVVPLPRRSRPSGR